MNTDISIEIIGLIVGVLGMFLGIMVQVATPELRRFFGLQPDKNKQLLQNPPKPVSSVKIFILILGIVGIIALLLSYVPWCQFFEFPGCYTFVKTRESFIKHIDAFVKAEAELEKVAGTPINRNEPYKTQAEKKASQNKVQEKMRSELKTIQTIAQKLVNLGGYYKERRRIKIVVNASLTELNKMITMLNTDKRDRKPVYIKDLQKYIEELRNLSTTSYSIANSSIFWFIIILFAIVLTIVYNLRSQERLANEQDSIT